MILLADQQLGNIAGVASRHVGSGTQRSNMSGSDTSPQNAAGDADANRDSIANMRARLTAINATSYTTARLNTMTTNDMLYAIRLADNPGGI